METQKKAEFTKRPDGKPLVVARHYASGDPIKTPVEVGDVRDLKIGDELIFVEVIDALGNGRFKGKIVSFESSSENEFQGYQTGDIIHFEEAHVWA